MDQIYKLKESIFGYLSPAKRRHTIQPATPTAMQRPIQFLTEPRGKERAVVAGRVSKKHLSPTDTKKMGFYRARRLDAGEDYVDDDDEIEVVTDLSRMEIMPDDSVSQIDNGTDIIETIEEYEDEGGDELNDREIEDYDEEEELNLVSDHDSELSAEAKVENFLEHQTLYEERKRAVEERRQQSNWTEEELALYQKLSMRGFEPLMHISWHYDFRTCPTILFSDDESKIHIDTRSSEPGSNFRAIRALRCLGTMGPRVRDLLGVKKPQEPFIKREIQAYVKWSQKDGGYHHMRFLPVICLIGGRPTQEISTIIKSAKDQLEFLAQRHRTNLALSEPQINEETGEMELFRRKPPILYGILIAHWVTIFITLDSSKPGDDIKVVSDFDFSNQAMDTWNSFAIALLVIAARNYTMQFIEEYEVDDKIESDPDA